MTKILIRDLIYIEKLNTFLLVLEEIFSIGSLKILK